jgi:FkbM family methyltransferase
MTTLTKPQTENSNIAHFSSESIFAKALHCYEQNKSFSELDSILPQKIVPRLGLHKVLRLLSKLKNGEKRDAEVYAQDCENFFAKRMNSHTISCAISELQSWSYFYLIKQLEQLKEKEYLERFKQCRSNNFSTNLGRDLKIIKKIFNNKKKGVFVEVGGNDGTTGSYSLLLEKDFAWNGVCIEASPWLFEKMKRTRSCICEQTALGQDVSKEDFYDFQYLHQLSGLKKEFRKNPLFQQYLDTSPHQTIEVKTLPFSHFSKKHNINHIDFFILDVEGAEFEVIKGIDFESTQIDVFLIEQASKELKNYLSNKGYKALTKIRNDTMFIHRKSKQFNDLKEPFNLNNTLKYSIGRL